MLKIQEPVERDRRGSSPKIHLDALSGGEHRSYITKREHRPKSYCAVQAQSIPNVITNPRMRKYTKGGKKKVPFGTVFTIIYILKISNEQPSIKGIED